MNVDDQMEKEKIMQKVDSSEPALPFWAVVFPAAPRPHWKVALERPPSSFFPTSFPAPPEFPTRQWARRADDGDVRQPGPSPAHRCAS